VLVVAASVVVAAGCGLVKRKAELKVLPVAEGVRALFALDPFYRKIVFVESLPVVGSANVSDEALLEAAWIVDRMLGRRVDILDAMAARKVRLAVMGFDEFTTDVPEHAHLEPAVYWDRRARGLGATPEAPAVSCAEENLLSFPGDPYEDENILIHELAHTVLSMGLSRVDPTFESRLGQAYGNALKRGLWRGTYAITNPEEYWAEGVQSWFDDNRENDALHNHVDTRSELEEYDPALGVLCAEAFGDGPWRYHKPWNRRPGERSHLASFDSLNAPHFRWRQHPLTEKPRVQIDTALGSLTVELDAVQAPVTTRNFLRYVLEGFYSDGEFFRTVTTSNQASDEIKIAVIQAGADPAREGEAFAPILLERTSKTGLRHLDGAISMARSGPDSATHSFFICVGDQPELDFEGARNPDGQGFAAFGRVVEGMELVREIHAMPADGQRLDPPLRIQRAVRTH